MRHPSSSIIARSAPAFAALAGLAACGPGDPLERPKTRRHSLFVENRSSGDVSLSFEAYYGSYCSSGTSAASVAAGASEDVEVVFEGCVNGGGDSIDGVTWTLADGSTGSLSYPRTSVHCTDAGCWTAP
jgi:hypothetical protein